MQVSRRQRRALRHLARETRPQVLAQSRRMSGRRTVPPDSLALFRPHSPSSTARAKALRSTWRPSMLRRTLPQSRPERPCTPPDAAAPACRSSRRRFETATLSGATTTRLRAKRSTPRASKSACTMRAATQRAPPSSSQPTSLRESSVLPPRTAYEPAPADTRPSPSRSATVQAHPTRDAWMRDATSTCSESPRIWRLSYAAATPHRLTTRQRNRRSTKSKPATQAPRQSTRRLRSPPSRRATPTQPPSRAESRSLDDRMLHQSASRAAKNARIPREATRGALRRARGHKRKLQNPRASVAQQDVVRPAGWVRTGPNESRSRSCRHTRRTPPAQADHAAHRSFHSSSSSRADIATQPVERDTAESESRTG